MSAELEKWRVKIDHKWRFFSANFDRGKKV